MSAAFRVSGGDMGGCERDGLREENDVGRRRERKEE